jgi:phospholipid/cholesterol/gamma-HCH transport system substrate-binding protein
MNSVHDFTRVRREPQNNRDSNLFRSGKFDSFARLLSLLLLAPISIGVATSFNSAKESGYQVYAEFNSVGSLPKGAAIEATGVRIGTVSQVSLTNAGLARVQMSIDEGVVLSQDSIISVQNLGVRGDKVVRIHPGKSEKTITAGETFPDTESGGQRPQEI